MNIFLKLLFAIHVAAAVCFRCLGKRTRMCGWISAAVYTVGCVCVSTATFALAPLRISWWSEETRHKIYHIQEHLFFAARLFKLLTHDISEIKETHFKQRKKLSPTILARQCRWKVWEACESSCLTNRTSAIFSREFEHQQMISPQYNCLFPDLSLVYFHWMCSVLKRSNFKC